MKSWDVIVIGSGAAGFAAAVTACCKGTAKILPKRLSAPGGRRWPFSSVRGQ